MRASSSLVSSVSFVLSVFLGFALSKRASSSLVNKGMVSPGRVWSKSALRLLSSCSTSSRSACSLAVLASRRACSASISAWSARLSRAASSTEVGVPSTPPVIPPLTPANNIRSTFSGAKNSLLLPAICSARMLMLSCPASVTPSRAAKRGSVTARRRASPLASGNVERSSISLARSVLPVPPS